MTFTVCLAVHVTRVFVLLMVNESVAVPVPEPLVPSTTWLAVDVNMASNEPVRAGARRRGELLTRRRGIGEISCHFRSPPP